MQTKILETKSCWETGILKMQTGWDTGTSIMQTIWDTGILKMQTGWDTGQGPWRHFEFGGAKKNFEVCYSYQI